MVVVASVFRDAEHYVERYFDQIWSLRAKTPVQVVAVEGDSYDQTWKKLQEYAGDTIEVLKAEHGGGKFGSIDHPLRWRQLSAACNVALCAAVRHKEPVIYVESDLLWDAGTMLRLLEHLDTYPAVAPMSFQHGRFYDTFGFQKDGVCFGHYPPYHPGVTNHMTLIDTAGSCTAMRPECAEVAEFSAIDCIRGIGRSLYANGYSLWLDPTLQVIHP